MSNVLTNGCEITVLGTDNVVFHTLDDWGLAIGNNDCIGDPVQYTDFVTIKGRSGLLDLSEALTGYPTYKSRKITIELGGLRDPKLWDSVMSDLRNKVDGRLVRLTFDNDKNFYWEGRIHLEDFDRTRNLGTFKLSMPNADPYKYSWQEYNEDWLWNPFDFETGYTTMKQSHTITGEYIVTIPRGYRPIVPVIEVETINTYLTVKKGIDGRAIRLSVGKNEIPQILVNGDTEETIIFNGDGTFSINFRGGSL